MDKFISIIVPVFKVEPYLECCLESLCRQSMPEIEIILIDDASPDGCGKICDAYAARDARIRVFHLPENKGLSAARNLGIQKATCDYLMFVDSDDWVADDYCREAYQCAISNNADLVMFDFQSVKNSEIVPRRTETVLEGRKTCEEAIDLLFTNVQNYAWNKLYRKELFNNILYPEGFIYEDIATTYKIIWKSSTVYYLPKTLYYYRSRPGSIVAEDSNTSKWSEMRIAQCRDLWNSGCKSNRFIAFQNHFGMSYCIRNKADSDPNYSFFAHVLRQNKTIPEGFSWKRKILFFLLKYYPPAFELVCNLLAR